LRPGAFSSIVRLVIVPPPVRYVRNGELSIAYQVVGDAAVDLVVVPGILNHMETVWEEPPLVRFIEALTRFSRVILLDRRGTGLSDRLPPEVVPTLDAQADDVRAVMDAAGSERAVILGGADGAQVAIGFAAAHSGRTRALALFSATPAALRREDVRGASPRSTSARWPRKWSGAGARARPPGCWATTRTGLARRSGAWSGVPARRARRSR
jgi:pimeloyl-ACP methyl ester carboxylesterase